jgi:hypothetical protein
VPLSKSIKDLIARTSGLKIEAENIQAYVSKVVIIYDIIIQI